MEGRLQQRIEPVLRPWLSGGARSGYSRASVHFEWRSRAASIAARVRSLAALVTANSSLKFTSLARAPAPTSISRTISLGPSCLPRRIQIYAACFALLLCAQRSPPPAKSLFSALSRECRVLYESLEKRTTGPRREILLHRPPPAGYNAIIFRAAFVAVSHARALERTRGRLPWIELLIESSPWIGRGSFFKHNHWYRKNLHAE